MERDNVPQAEGWVIKGKLVRSKKFNALNGDDFTQKIYCLLIACKDSWGMMPADSFSLKANLGPLDETKKPPAYKKAIMKLRDVGLIYLWDHQGAPWLYVLGHDEEAPIGKRALNPQVPRPDLDAMWTETKEVMTKSGLSHDFVSHPPARARSQSQSPFPNPNPDPDPTFAQFWKAYPKKKSKGDAEKAWNKIKPNEDLLSTIMATLEKLKASHDWRKENGKYIPYPASWLRAKGWEDSVDVEIEDDGIPQGSAHNMAVMRRLLDE